MYVKKLILILIMTGIARMEHAVAETPHLKIAIIGDSTVCDYAVERLQRGWGQLLPGFYQSDVSFLNAAVGGRSAKSFEPYRWQKVLAFKPDFILIQFGHNDSHPKDRPESTDAATDFKEYLRHFIADARSIGAEPVLITPPHRRQFDSSGHVSQELLPYAQAMKEVGQEKDVPVVDLYARSAILFQNLGEEKSTPYTMNKSGSTLEDTGVKITSDRTHFTEVGAKALAEIIAEDLAGINPKLKASLKEQPTP